MGQNFEELLTEKFRDIEIVNRSEVRWWMAAGMHTDETILEELNAMHRAGFGGVELCQLADATIDGSVYGYGTAQWEHDVKLILNTALDLGMSVSLTSGAGWSTANVPGLDPDSEAANRCAVLVTEELAGGQSRKGPLPTNEKLREKAVLIGAVAVRRVGETVYDKDRYFDLTEEISEGTLEWTAPKDGDYTLMVYYAQGTAQAASPAKETSYTINYFDRRGFECLKGYLTENLLNDDEIREKIRGGNVQFFMDSLEYNHGKGITNWTETFREEFRKRKGYDILPYLFLAHRAPITSIWGWSDNADLIGFYNLNEEGAATRILNDLFDVQTRLYLEEFIAPFHAWLNSCGITLRAQISYGKNLEISLPIASVDYPEAENRNQNNQVDMYRIWSGGAHLLNKVLSSETGGLDNSAYCYTYQRHLQEAYALYSAGYSRMIWHIWSATYGPRPVWPGYEGGDRKHIYYKFGTREPSYSEYSEFNAHLGRIQKLLRQGVAGVDVGMPYVKYGQHLVYLNEEDWMHTHRPMFFPSTALQDNGYTYDYFNPELLDAEGVGYDASSGTLEQGGYRAIVLWQAELPLEGAKKLLALAQKGMPTVLLKGAACRSPYFGEDEGALAAVVAQMKELKNVAVAEDGDGVLSALATLGVCPYLGFSKPNRQLLTQTRREGADRYVFVYNYCDGALHGEDNEPHGDVIGTELVADGLFVPYAVDAWNGEVKKIASYCHKEGKTVFPLTLRYGDVALFALKSTDGKEPHFVTPADLTEVDGKTVLRTFTSGDFHLRTAEGASLSGSATVPPPFEIRNWDLTVEAVVPTEEVLTRRETLLGVNTEEYACRTDKKILRATLERLAPWEDIPEIGREVSGKGFYRASFFWDGAASGAALDFGTVTQSMQVFVNGKKTDPVNMNLPRVDISSLLKVGENEITVEYSSNLNNLQLSRGAIPEGILPSGFLGYEIGYQSYGLRKATVVPYGETVLNLPAKK